MVPLKSPAEIERRFDKLLAEAKGLEEIIASLKMQKRKKSIITKKLKALRFAKTFQKLFLAKIKHLLTIVLSKGVNFNYSAFILSSEPGFKGRSNGIFIVIIGLGALSIGSSFLLNNWSAVSIKGAHLGSRQSSS